MAAGIKPIISQADLQQNISQSLFNLQKEVTKIESALENLCVKKSLP